MSTPPVSTSRNSCPVHSQTSSLRSRVTPGVSWTTACREPVSRLTSVDLPTFGKPTIATRAEQARLGLGRRRRRRDCSCGRSAPWAVRACASTRKSQRRRISRLDRAPRPRGSPCRVLRQAVETHRLAPRDRDRVKVPTLPELRAVDRRRDDRHVLLQRDHRRAGLHLARARPTRWRVPSTKRPSAWPSRDELAASSAPPRGPTRLAAPRTCRTRGSADRGRGWRGPRSSPCSRSCAGSAAPKAGGSSQ